MLKLKLINQLEQEKIAESYFDKMKDLLRQKSPDLESVVDIALKQERLKDEKKNQKVIITLSLSNN